MSTVKLQQYSGLTRTVLDQFEVIKLR